MAWLPLGDGDPADRVRDVACAHAAFLAGAPSGAARSSVREVVERSWRRSAGARVDPDAEPPVVLVDDELTAYRDSHPLAGVIGLLRELVAADDGDHLLAVSDVEGRLLWVEGNRAARRRAEVITFVEGSVWDEPHAGTNAPGTALALDQPVQIFASEHYRPAVQAWTCAAAPIHDPVTGQTLGVVDITGGDHVAHPYSLALVRAAARAAEAQLSWQRSGPATLWVPAAGTASASAAAPRLEALGRNDAVLTLGERTVRLQGRHAEVMVILAAHPAGMNGNELADALYGDLAVPTTLRVELTRLRGIVGGILQSRPYRLAEPVEADFLDVAAALRRGDAGAAVAAYPGPLLPSSEAPEVGVQRRRLDAHLRTAVLAEPDPGVVAELADNLGFDDLELWERLLALLPHDSPRRPVAVGRVRQLRADYGLRPAQR